MKWRIYTRVLLFLLLVLESENISSTAVEKNTTGIIILDLDRNCTSFDLFVPLSVKPNKSLIDNIKVNKAKMGYLLLIKQNEQLEQLVLSRAKKIRNSEVPDGFAENLKYNLVAVVDIRYQEVTLNSSKNEVYDYPIKFNGQFVLNHYDSSMQIEVMDVNFISLPE